MAPATPTNTSTPPATNPSSSSLIPELSDQKEDLHFRPFPALVDKNENLGRPLSVTVVETISLTSWSLTLGMEGNTHIYETPTGRIPVHTKHDDLVDITMSVTLD